MITHSRANGASPSIRLRTPVKGSRKNGASLAGGRSDFPGLKSERVLYTVIGRK